MWQRAGEGILRYRTRYLGGIKVLPPRWSICCKVKCVISFYWIKWVSLWGQDRPRTFRCNIQSFSLREFSSWANISHSDSSRITRGKVRQAEMEMPHQFKREEPHSSLGAVATKRCRACFRLKKNRSEILTLGWIPNWKKSHRIFVY